MFLLCLAGVVDAKRDGHLWPGDERSRALLGQWFENIKGSRCFYYILFAEYLRPVGSLR